MSIHYLSPLSEYWKDYYMLGIPEFAKVTPRGRLLDINIYLHLNDNSYTTACDSAKADTLYQLRPFLVSLTANLSHCYNPNSEQAVEEARIKYKWYTFLKQYMPMKSIKLLMKRWPRADCYSGY